MLRWLVKADGSRVLQRCFGGDLHKGWKNVPEVREEMPENKEDTMRKAFWQFYRDVMVEAQCVRGHSGLTEKLIETIEKHKTLDVFKSSYAD